MGTRHLIAATIDGDFKLAQYGQWDGYPSGQGLGVLRFLQAVVEGGNLEHFKDRVRELRWATDEDFDRVNAAAGVTDDGSGWITLEEAEKLKQAAPALSRDTGSEILQMIFDGAVEFVHDQRDFALDSLFCEYAYVIDLDAGVLEAYRGFQHERPTSGKWAGRPTPAEHAEEVAKVQAKLDAGEYTQDQFDYFSKLDYCAIELVATWPLDALPDEVQFHEDLDESDDEDDDEGDENEEQA